MKERLKDLKPKKSKIKVQGYDSTFVVSEVRLQPKYGTTGAVFCYPVSAPNVGYQFPGYMVKLDKSN